MDLLKETKQKAGSPPDFSGDGIAIWVNETKEGKPYLSIQLFGKNGIKVNAFKVESKK